ncbi:MAG: phosphatidylglycerol lysyltransferase domain-containing protein [Candidatus Omnitrophica bacterium]|jgi:hypothetical protein|nr:phosphatidylglycerol lysyltransferase domain-containing protein [Candidatus Omnitrophota bacterium]
MSFIPSYPEFIPLDLAHKPIFDAAFKESPPEISEFTFTNLFSWRQVYGYKLCLLDGWLILRSGAGKNLFLPPIGTGDASGPVRAILLDSRGEFCRVPEDLARVFGGDDSFVVREDRDNFDYLYYLSDLTGLAGRKYDGKRNLIRKFKSGYLYDYADITPAGSSRILEFEQAWCLMKDCETAEGLENERRAVLEIAEHFAEFRLSCGVIRVGGVIRAMAVAEALNPETMVMHIFKADSGIPGLYQTMLNEFLRCRGGNFKYLNLEQDLGIPGLRASKESYHPVRMIKKYTIALKE